MLLDSKSLGRYPKAAGEWLRLWRYRRRGFNQ